jgi:preprotein translocase subunit SecA
VQLRSYGQRDPLVEYKQEAFKLYDTLMNSIKDLVCTNVFRYRMVPNNGAAQAAADASGAELPEASSTAARGSVQAMHQKYGQFGGEQGQGGLPAQIHRATPKVGRNDPCPCGSGKKYKNCHGR